jgi:hypothetical protein
MAAAASSNRRAKKWPAPIPRRKLFPTTVVNELGHQVDYVYEYGTGNKLETDGPNTRTCTTNCPAPASIYPLKEQHKIRVDGLGREIERWETASDDGSVYTLYQTAGGAPGVSGGIVNLTRSSRPSWPLSLEMGQRYRRAKDFSAPNRRATNGRRIPPLLKLTMPFRQIVARPNR